jgi:hypothetical protein
MPTKTARFEFRATDEFMDRLATVSRKTGLSKPEALGAGLELLEKLADAAEKGKEIAFVDSETT